MSWIMGELKMRASDESLRCKTGSGEIHRTELYASTDNTNSTEKVNSTVENLRRPCSGGRSVWRKQRLSTSSRKLCEKGDG